jgi:hypothetical protein
VSHNDVNGVSFWDDRGRGRIVHLRVEELGDGPDEASALTVNEWRADDGTVLLRERHGGVPSMESIERQWKARPVRL